MLNTVNVIVMDNLNLDITSLNAFEDNKEGNTLAEELFTKLCRMNTKFTFEEINDMIDDGISEYGNWKAVIWHSQG